jgi:type IV pilus assembly protein PilW
MCKLNRKFSKGKSGEYGARHQAGATLMEAMISLALSLVVTTAMVTLMGNSMGSATRITQMSQLTDELRNAMSMMSRDIRRANFNANSIYCYANSDCGIDGSASQYADITITNNSCFVFGLDRDWDGDASNDGPGAFRRITVGADSIGVIEMWTGTGLPNCGTASNDWVAVTDPDFIDITIFNVDGSSSFSQELTQGGGVTLTQRTRRVQLQLSGRLILDNSITRTVEDTIMVRNDVFL